MTIVSAIATSLFLGGWAGPGVAYLTGTGTATGWIILGNLLGVFYFIFKVYLLCCIFIWIRATLPRLRSDQLMQFAWLILIPVTLGTIVLTGLNYLIVSNFGMSNVVFLIVTGVINWVLLFGFIRLVSRATVVSTRHAQAAQSLGQMNGAYLAGRPLPSYPWLVSSGSPRGLLDHYGWMWKIVHDPFTWQHPRLCAAFPLPIASRLLRLWEDHDALLDVLERLPQTFGHLDAWRRNLFAAPERDGQHQLIAIDWANPGLGTIATDIGDLFAASFSMFGVEPCDPRTLDTVIFQSYLEGLSAAGWRGDRRMVRYAFAIFTALKYGCFLHWLSQIIDECQYASWERRTGHPLEECIQNQARLTYHLLDLADEARNLIDSV